MVIGETRQLLLTIDGAFHGAGGVSVSAAKKLGHNR
jgi:hypothetical protein